VMAGGEGREVAHLKKPDLPQRNNSSGGTTNRATTVVSANTKLNNLVRKVGRKGPRTFATHQPPPPDVIGRPVGRRVHHRVFNTCLGQWSTFFCLRAFGGRETRIQPENQKPFEAAGRAEALRAGSGRSRV